MGNIFNILSGWRRTHSRSNDNSVPRQSSPPPVAITPRIITPPNITIVVPVANTPRIITPITIITPPHIVPVAITPRPIRVPVAITPRGDNQNASSPPTSITLPPAHTQDPAYPAECCFFKITTNLIIEYREKYNKVSGDQVGTCKCLPCGALDAKGNPSRETKSRLLNESRVGTPTPLPNGKGSIQEIKIVNLYPTAYPCESEGTGDPGGDGTPPTGGWNTGDCKGTRAKKIAAVQQYNMEDWKESELGKNKLYDIDDDGNPVGIWVTLQAQRVATGKRGSISLGGKKSVKLDVNAGDANKTCK